MPKLSNPIIAPVLSAADLERKLKPIISSKNWGSFSIKSMRLILCPIYLFSYEAFKEENKKGHKIVTESFKGKALFNAHTSTLLLNKTIDISKASDDSPKDIDFEILESHTDDSHIDRILALNLSKALMIQKDNVIISNLKKAYLSELIASVYIDDKLHEVKVDGISGNISESIPIREKTFSELAKETVSELKEPEAWVEYSKSIIQGAYKGEHFKGINPLYFQLGLLLLIFIILIWVALLK
ncbi:MAG: hypothetical protein AABW72_06055 [archaeon]